MSIDDLKPTTLAGIKTLAKDLKRLHSLKHQPSLDLAAQRAGYSNHDHARNVLGQKTQAAFEVVAGHISVYWNDEHTQESGRVTISFPFQKLISQLLTQERSEITDHYLLAYKLEAPDHLERRFDASCRRSAIEFGYSAAYALQFMDRVGLTSANLDLPEGVGDALRSMQSGDHISGWRSKSCPQGWVVLEEPNSYMGRKAWAIQNNFSAIECFLHGLHRGGGLFTTVFSSHDDLAALAADSLNSIHKGKGSIEIKSADYSSNFVSPYRKISQKKRKPRVMPIPEGTIKDGSIAYGSMPGAASDWRPNFQLPIEEHLKIGPTLAALLPPFDSDENDPLHSVKFDLCNWFYKEYGEAITDEIDAAYDGLASDQALQSMDAFATHGGKIEAVEQVIQIITNGYPSCHAIDIQVKALKKAQALYRNSSEKL